jgi:hypothetical protein
MISSIYNAKPISSLGQSQREYLSYANPVVLE